MGKAIAIANSVTAVWSTAHALCAMFALVAPDLYFMILRYWFHSINLELIKSTVVPTVPTVLLGFLSFSAYVWTVVFVTAFVYYLRVPKQKRK